jgi:hypothetical protein
MAKPLGRFPINANRPLHWCQEAQHQFQQGGLTAAIGADNGHKILLPDGKVHILKYGFSAIGKIKIFISMIVMTLSLSCLFQCRLELVCDLTQIGHPVFSQRIGKGHLAADLPGDEFRAFG